MVAMVVLAEVLVLMVPPAPASPDPVGSSSVSGTSGCCTDAATDGDPSQCGAEQPGSGQQAGSGSGAGAGGAGQGGGSSDNVFVPDTVDLSEFEGVDVELDADCFGGGDECGELQNETPAEFTDEGGSIVPYTQVLGDYQGAVNEALSDNAIPLGYKQFIRDYFSSLEPER